MQPQDLYIRLTDPSGCKPDVLNYHRVWDKQLFINAQKTLHEVKAKGDDIRLVQIATEAEYITDRKGEKA